MTNPVPTLSTEQPLNVAIPAMEATVRPPVHVSAAPAAFRPSARVTSALLPVDVPPPESATRTTGWVVNGVAIAAPAGCVPNSSWAAGPGLTVIAALVADV